MFESLFAWLQGIALAGGAKGVFFLAFLQEIIPPIPSTLVTVASGGLFLSGSAVTLESFGHLIAIVALPIALGMTLGSVIIYGLVYWGGAPLIKRFGHLVGTSWDDIERLQGRLSGTAVDEIAFFALRSFPLTPSILLNVVCGLVRWNPLSFIISTFFGTLIRAAWSGFIGWQLGSALSSYSSFVERANWIVLIGFALAVIGFFAYRRYTAKKKAAAEESIEA